MLPLQASKDSEKEWMEPGEMTILLGALLLRNTTLFLAEEVKISLFQSTSLFFCALFLEE
jgi:hypothetical protein